MGINLRILAVMSLLRNKDDTGMTLTRRIFMGTPDPCVSNLLKLTVPPKD